MKSSIPLSAYLTQLRNSVDTQQCDQFEDLLFNYRVDDHLAMPTNEDSIHKLNRLLSEMALQCGMLCQLMEIMSLRLDKQEERIEDLEKLAVRDGR